jgi:hypothetical protein
MLTGEKWNGTSSKSNDEESCYVCYAMFVMASIDAQKIRDYIRVRYVEPARKRKETLVTLRAGDIHRELGLRNRVPNVCQAMESKLLEKQAGVRVSSKQGPPSGRGTTLTVTYTVDLQARNHGTRLVASETKTGLNHPGVALFYALRGQGAEVFASEGGGESWLKRERASFYKPSKKGTA